MDGPQMERTSSIHYSHEVISVDVLYEVTKKGEAAHLDSHVVEGVWSVDSECNEDDMGF